MARLSITLTDEALKIYESWKPHDRSKKVSEAIVQYNTEMNTRVENLEKQVKKLKELIERK